MEPSLDSGAVIVQFNLAWKSLIWKEVTQNCMLACIINAATKMCVYKKRAIMRKVQQNIYESDRKEKMKEYLFLTWAKRSLKQTFKQQPIRSTNWSPEVIVVEGSEVNILNMQGADGCVHWWFCSSLWYRDQAFDHPVALLLSGPSGVLWRTEQQKWRQAEALISFNKSSLIILQD